MSDIEHRDFLADVLEYINETIVVHKLFESENLLGTLKLRSCYCGFELEMAEEGGDTFAELNCWLMQDEDNALDLSAYTTEHTTALTDAVQSNFRWVKIFRESDTLTLYRSEWLVDESEERDMIRVVRMVESVVAEAEYLYPVVQELLLKGQDLCHSTSVEMLLQTPAAHC